MHTVKADANMCISFVCSTSSRLLQKHTWWFFNALQKKNRWRRSLALIWNTWGKSNAIAHSAINHNPAELSVSVIFSLQRPSWSTFPPLWSTVFKSVKLVVGSESMPLISRFKTGCFIYFIFLKIISRYNMIKKR